MQRLLDTCASGSISPDFPANRGHDPHDPVAVVAAILSLPDEQLDYGRAKLAFDRVVDPSLDMNSVTAELERLTDNALCLASAPDRDNAKLEALRKLLHESGPWNEHRPFAYDHSEPLGQSIPGKLMANYLATRRGDCVSMPILFLILADRLGLDMALATAPLHIFLRHRDEQGRVLNIEATSGAHPARDTWFHQNFPMSGRALESGLYMRTLTRREGTALMASTILEHLIDEERFHEAVEVAEIILRHNPRDGLSMVKLGSACAHLMRVEFADKYPAPAVIPLALRSRYLMLAEKNRATFAAAEILGWEPVE